MLALHVIGSGSKGNCAVVENVDEGRGVLVDCGICKRDVFGFAAEAGFSMDALDAILLRLVAVSYTHLRAHET